MFTIQVAGVFYWDYGITPYVFLKYVAVDKKYFPRLQEIAENEPMYGYHEFKRKDDGITEEEIKRTWEENSSKVVPEPEGEELLEGLGMEDVVLCFGVPLVTKRKFEKYRYAYKVGNTLVLIRKNWNCNV